MHDSNKSLESVIQTENSGTDADKLSETCFCSRKSKLIMLKCKDLKNGDQCQPFSHPESKCNCINK